MQIYKSQIKSFLIFIIFCLSTFTTNARDNLTYDDLSVEMPNYGLLDYQEDWSSVKDYTKKDLKKDPWLKYKYIPMKHYSGGWMSFGGEMRDRLERWENFIFTPGRNDTLNLWRILVHGDFNFSDDLRLFLEVKSALASKPSVPDEVVNSFIDEFALQQLFLEIHPFQDKAAFLFRLGRQEVAFPRYRLITIAPWSNVFRTWDGITTIYKHNYLQLTGLALQIVQVRPTQRNPSYDSDRLYGMYGQYNSPKLKYDFYWLFDHIDNFLFQGPTLNTLEERNTDNRNTVGFRYFKKSDVINYDFEFAYQFGRWGPKTVNAYMLASSYSYNFTHIKWSPTFFWGYDYATGGPSNTNTLNTFNQLDPAGHLYLGFADAIGRQNINSPNVGFSLKPKQSMNLSFAYHYFRRQNPFDAVYLPSGGILREGLTSRLMEIGNELDTYFTKAFDKHTRILLGYTFFVPGPFIKATGPSETIKFYYLQLRYVV